MIDRIELLHVVKVDTFDGRTYEAKMIHLNPQYHRKAESLDVWRREGDVPRKQRYVQPKDVESWEAIE
jgi:hypothetical protein